MNLERLNLKVVFILSSLLVFVLGGCLGMWFGIETVYIEVETIPTKTVFDKITLLATIIAATGTLITTFLAIWAYAQWKKQQNEIELIKIRKNIIINISSLKNSILMIIYRSSNIDGAKKESLADLSVALLELKSNIELYYVLSNKKIEIGELSGMSVYAQDDFLDNTKEFFSMAHGLHFLLSFKFAFCYPSFLIFDDYSTNNAIGTLLNKSIKIFIKRVSDENYRATVKKIESEMNDMSELAMYAVSNKNAEH